MADSIKSLFPKSVISIIYPSSVSVQPVSRQTLVGNPDMLYSDNAGFVRNIWAVCASR